MSEKDKRCDEARGLGATGVSELLKIWTRRLKKWFVATEWSRKVWALDDLQFCIIEQAGNCFMGVADPGYLFCLWLLKKDVKFSSTSF